MRKLNVLGLVMSALFISVGAQASNTAQVASGPKPEDSRNCFYSYSIQKIGPTFVERGDLADFLIVVQNLGTCRLRDVRVSDSMSEGEEFVSATPTPSSVDDERVRWNDINIPAGRFDVFSVRARITDRCSSTLTDTACAFAPQVGVRICDSWTTTVLEHHHD